MYQLSDVIVVVWFPLLLTFLTIIITAVLGIILTNRSNKTIIDSTNSMIEFARTQGVQCVDKSINALAVEIKDLGTATV